MPDTNNRSALSRIARAWLKPLIFYARDPRRLLEREEVGSAQGLKFLCKRENLIEHNILSHGVWEPAETAFVQKLVRPGFVSFDVGANIGYFTLLLSRLVGPRGQVHAFEPTRYAFDRLVRNRELNPGLDANLFLNRTGLLAVPIVKEDSLEARFSGRVAAHSEREDIAFTTIDEYCAQNAVGRIDFLKVDVDGYDYDVIRGGIQVIKRDRPILLVELYDKALRTRGADVAEYVQLLLELGYDRYTAAHDGTSGRLAELANNASLRKTSWNVVLEP